MGEIIAVSATSITVEGTTFAVNAATVLTDASGAPLGEALALIERLETVQRQIGGTRGDHQFRM